MLVRRSSEVCLYQRVSILSLSEENGSLGRADIPSGCSTLSQKSSLIGKKQGVSESARDKEEEEALHVLVHLVRRSVPLSALFLPALEHVSQLAGLRSNTEDLCT